MYIVIIHTTKECVTVKSSSYPSVEGIESFLKKNDLGELISYETHF